MASTYKASFKGFHLEGMREKVYVGQVTYYESGRRLFSESTGIKRLTKNDALADAHGKAKENGSTKVEYLFTDINGVQVYSNDGLLEI